MGLDPLMVLVAVHVVWVGCGWLGRLSIVRGTNRDVTHAPNMPFAAFSQLLARANDFDGTPCGVPRFPRYQRAPTVPGAAAPEAVLCRSPSARSVAGLVIGGTGCGA